MDVLLTSPWIPAEWIKAHGHEPRGIWFAPGFGSESLPLAAGTCGFAQSALALAQRQSGAALVFTTHCDQLRRTFDAVPAQASERTFLFNLPATTQTEVGLKMFYAELERLGRFLCRMGGHRPSASTLASLMRDYDAARRRLCEAAAWCPPRRYAEAIGQFHWEGSTEISGASRPDGDPNDQLVPIALLGGPLLPVQFSLFDEIEKAGGRVALNGTESGERSLGAAERTVIGHGRTSQSPNGAAGADLSSLLEALTRWFMDNCADAFQRPNHRLYEWVKARLAARKVRGIVLYHYSGCDLWRAEAETLRETFGRPLLLLETDESGSGFERSTGRIQAFMEALRCP